MNQQLTGIHDLAGTYIFDVTKSVKAIRLNRFFWRHRELEFRERAERDFETVANELKLTEEERGLVQRLDWLGLIQYGVCFFVLEKFARVKKTTNLEVYASMRSETLEEFLATRRVPDSR